MQRSFESFEVLYSLRGISMCATACWDLHAGVDVQRSCSFNCLFASMICMFEAANTASYAEICSYRNCRSIGMNFQRSKTGTSS